MACVWDGEDVESAIAVTNVDGRLVVEAEVTLLRGTHARVGLSVGGGTAWSIAACFAGFLTWRRYVEFRIKRRRFRLSAGIEDTITRRGPHR